MEKTNKITVNQLLSDDDIKTVVAYSVYPAYNSSSFPFSLPPYTFYKALALFQPSYEVVETFQSSDIVNADGLIIAWIDRDGKEHASIAGLSDIEAVGLLNFIQADIKNEARQ